MGILELYCTWNGGSVMKLNAISKLDNFTPMFRANKMSNQSSAPVPESPVKPGFAIGTDGDVHPESRTANKGQKLYILA